MNEIFEPKVISTTRTLPREEAPSKEDVVKQIIDMLTNKSAEELYCTLDLSNPDHLKVYREHCRLNGVEFPLRTIMKLSNDSNAPKDAEQMVKDALKAIPLLLEIYKTVHTAVWRTTHGIFPELKEYKDVTLNMETLEITYLK